MFDPRFSEDHLNPVLVFVAIKQVDIATHIELRAVYHGSHFSILTKFPDFSSTFFPIFSVFFNILFFN